MITPTEAVWLFIILVGALGLLFLDAAGVGPVHRWLSRNKKH